MIDNHDPLLPSLEHDSHRKWSIHARFSCLAAVALVAVVGTGAASAANILWVSDAWAGNAPTLGFTGPGTGRTDQAFITLLQNAGHTVERYNGPEANTTLIPAADVTRINTNDLIIIGRTSNSGQFQEGQGDQWNTAITKPLICMSPYLVRTLAGTANRMGWFTAGNLPDDLPTVATAVDPTNPVTDYLLGDVPMLGTNTIEQYDEAIDRNTSHITDPVVTGGRILISATFPTEANTNTMATGAVVADLPAGTSVRSGLNTLAGYRMFFAGGSREGATSPNRIELYAGRENLTATGESIFLRAVQVALNEGAAPATDPNAPPVVVTSPAGITVSEGQSATFSVAVTGAAPRTLQWQRDTGDGITFVDIPGASTTFLKSSYTIPSVTTADNGAKFRVVVGNNNGNATSLEATLTVMEDTAAPIPLTATSVDGMGVLICFNELLDNTPDFSTAEDEFNYAINDGSLNVNLAVLQPDGKSVLLTLDGAVGPTFTVKTILVEDRNDNAMTDGGVTINGSTLGLTATAVGAVTPGGSVVACDANGVQVIGGGLDLGSTSDTFEFAYKSVEGDFDARVRFTSIVGSLRFESVAKGILTARETTDAGSAAVNVYVTGLPPANDSIGASVRPSTGAATNIVALDAVPGGLPNAWMRITREGNLFTTYKSADGNSWVEMGNVTVGLAPTLVVGMGAASHRNGFLATATFSDFQVLPLLTQPTISSPVLDGTTFSATFESQAGSSYIVQFKDNLSDPTWQMLTTIPGDGTVKTFTDPATGASRFYRILVE